ncbi:MAG: penicillin-binding transpeptidase domain-containing protein [Spirochaetaceae bacterium]
MKQEKKHSLTVRRFSLFVLFTSLFVILLTARFFQVMVLNSTTSTSAEASVPSRVERGPILDRNGRILAIQTRLYSVTAWLPNVKDIEHTAGTLAPLLKVDRQDLLDRLRSRNGFIYIQRKISPSTSEEIRSLIEEGELPGVSLEPEYGRNYPQKELAGHVLGYVGTDNTGLDGVELTHEHILSPEKEDEAAPAHGNQLFLTLDINIQHMAEELASKAHREHDANSVMVMVVDAKSGNFLAWASTPSFDPNLFSRAEAETKRNLPIVSSYEPGSVFKVFSMASIMDLGGITPESTFYCDGAYEKEFSDDETAVINCLSHHGDVDAQRILQYSCNAGAAYASDTVDSPDFYTKLTDFGFGNRTHLPLPGETSGILRNYSSWSGRTKPTIAIGQEVSVTAAQMATAATALTNEGIILQPNLVKQIVSAEGETIEENERNPVKRVVSPEVAKAILLMMETATEKKGTAWRAKIPNVRTSAKTGTAQKVDQASGLYSPQAFVASTLSIFPTDDPQIITYVAIDTPKGEDFYGGRIAAPLVGELGEKLVNYLGIPAEDETVATHSGVIRLPQIPEIKIDETLPDFRGLPKRRLLPLLSAEELDASFEGEGWVVRQTPPPGTRVEEGMEIILEFE